MLESMLIFIFMALVVYFTTAQIIEHLNDGTIRYGYLYFDEHYKDANARENNSVVVKTITKLSNQMRKKHLHVTYITPFARQLDWIEVASSIREYFAKIIMKKPT